MMEAPPESGSRRPGPYRAGPRVVALGGGHGLAVTLRALRTVTDRLTAVVGVADDGGSSGRLRRELGVPPPGDLRMALAALCGDDAWGRTWSEVVQHRFGAGQLAGHAVGNLLISALWEQTGDLVVGLDWVAALLGANGRVLPACREGLEIVATVADAPGRPGLSVIRGQSRVAKAGGAVIEFGIDPAEPEACAEAVTAIGAAEALVMGPGSWYTSVLASLLVPGLRSAFAESPATKVLVLNLVAQQGETTGFRPKDHIDVLARTFPEVRFDAVLADARHVPNEPRLRAACARIGAELHIHPIVDARADPGLHDPMLLGRALNEVIGHGSIPAWR